MHSRSVSYSAVLVAVAIVLTVFLWPDPRLRDLATTTLLLSGSVAALSAVIGIPLAVILFRTNVPGARLLIASLCVLLFVPLYLQAAAWIAALGSHGWWGPALGAGWLNGLQGTIWIHTAASIPWMVLIVGLGLLAVEPELEEAALLDASVGAVLRRVTLPRAAGAACIGMLWVAIVTAGEMTVTNLFLVRTFAEEIYTQFALEADADQAFAASLPGILATALLLVAGLTVTQSIASSQFEPSARQRRRFFLGAGQFIVAPAAWIGVGILTLLPLASLAYKAGLLLSRDGTIWHRYWSLAKLCRVVGSSLVRFQSEFQWSLLIAVLAATLAIVCAAPLAWQASRSWRRAVPVVLLIATCFALPGPVIGIGLIALIDRPDLPMLTYLYDNTVVPTVVVQAVRAFPVVALVCWHAFQTVPRELLEMAAIEGTRPGCLFTRVALPMRRGALFAAWLIGSALALGELPASLLVAPPGLDLLSVRIFNLIHYGVDDQIAGICLVLAAGLLAIALVAIAVLRVRTRPSD